MKLLLFFLVMLATWYLAAMYHLVSLLALAIAQFLLLLFMFAVSRYLKGHLKCGFKGETLVLPKQHRTPCPLVVKNTGRLPSAGIGCVCGSPTGTARVRQRHFCPAARAARKGPKQTFISMPPGAVC